MKCTNDHAYYWQSLLAEADDTAKSIVEDIRRIREALTANPDMIAGDDIRWMTNTLQGLNNTLIAVSTFHVYRALDLVWTAAAEKEKKA